MGEVKKMASFLTTIIVAANRKLTHLEVFC